MKPYWCPVNSCWVPSGTLQIWAPTKINLGFAAQKTKNAYFLPLSTAPVPCKSQIISNIDDRSELVLSMRCCSQLVRSSWLLFPTSAQLVGNGFAGLSLVPWTSVIQNGRRIILIRNSHKKSVPVWCSEGLSVQSPFRILPGLPTPQRQHSKAALL